MRHIVVGLALLVTSCTTSVNGPTVPDTAGDTSTAAPATAEAAGADCGTGGYVAAGPLGRVGDGSGDTEQILSISLDTQPECERVTLEFATRGGAPATQLSPAQVELLADLGIVRVSFSTVVQSSALAESVFEGSIAQRAYVVRDLNGRIFVDVILGGAAEARLMTNRTPARLVVELRPSDAEPPAGPVTSDLIVVTSPIDPVVSPPLQVTGYARTLDGQVIGRVTDGAGTAEERVTASAAYVETWGSFLMTLEQVPEGPFQLFVGGQSPADGSRTGVTIDLESR